MCYCLECQKRTGSTYGVQARWPASQVLLEGRSSRFVRVGDEGNSITFHFCPDCGSTVYYQFDARPELVAVAVGNFADLSFPPPVSPSTKTASTLGPAPTRRKISGNRRSAT